MAFTSMKGKSINEIYTLLQIEVCQYVLYLIELLIEDCASNPQKYEYSVTFSISF